MTNVQRRCIGRDGDDIMSCWNVTVVWMIALTGRLYRPPTHKPREAVVVLATVTDTDVSLFHMTGLHTQALWPFSHKQTSNIFIQTQTHSSSTHKPVNWIYFSTFFCNAFVDLNFDLITVSKLILTQHKCVLHGIFDRWSILLWPSDPAPCF